MLSRRRTLALLAAAGTGSVLAACGPNAPSSSSAEGSALRVYWWGAELRAGLTQEVLDMFTQDHPDLAIAPEYSEWSSYWDKLATQTAGGTAPDVIQMDEAYIDSYGSNGSLLDLESVPDVLDLSAMDEAILETGRLSDGTLVGAPNGFNLYATGMNPAVLERAGIELPDDTTWTWDDFLALCQELTEWGRSSGENVFGTSGFGRGSGDLAAWGRQSGDQQLFPREGEEMVTKDTIVSLLEFSLRLGDEGAAPDADTQIENAGASLEQGMFATASCAFQQVPSSQILTFQDSTGDPLQLLRMPARESGNAAMVNKASMYWSIGANTADSQNAARLTSFMLTDSAAAEVLKIERGIPAFPAVQEAVRPLLTENELVSLDFAQTMQEEVVTPPVVTPASGVGFGDEYTRIAEAVLFGQTAPSDAADEILEILTSMQPGS
ncbi:ABC transporter substrate-binding protein [Brachybacterium saurashtrense]|uniref:Extracellular solute-binding protein n=1 Tax=Brachybacterium saurashtrense TaxID=556288 RepID=A0A345YQZ5_9MICO|nr:extracellular solute-binding protein [Brachybacterium saurashtrense]AXK46347.1 extracellular solute-binding protein [Brachybacterium saurashtrense]RRR24087.1 extracellular solute-binding protein [Brachybacterium saurashtrense]